MGTITSLDAFQHDLMQHYSYPRVVQSLKTKSAHTAKTRAFVAAAKLDEYWSHLRMTDADLFGRNLLKPGYRSFSTNTQLNLSMELEQNISLTAPSIAKSELPV